jgi:NAD(P)-dependent dehydrogenase (short-subunit alcohol dehydrogenase family)
VSRKWTADDVPDQSGRVAIVTGGNSGLGRITALELTRHGAQVVLASRTIAKGEEAAADIAAATGEPPPRVHELDLGSLESIRRFAAALANQRVDLLVNNAGVMMTPQSTTSDGFELQLGTNHLGQFALTGRLLPALAQSEGGRVVTVSSNEHKAGRIDFDDPDDKRRGYSPRGAYRRSKLANAIFAVELDARLRAAGSSVRSVLAHPGYAATNLQSSGPTGVVRAVLAVSNRLVAQRAELGALPTLYAATAPGVEGGEYYGPDGFAEMRGHPTLVKAIPAVYDAEIRSRLWQVSEELTGVRYSGAIAGLPFAARRAFDSR